MLTCCAICGRAEVNRCSDGVVVIERLMIAKTQSNWDPMHYQLVSVTECELTSSTEESRSPDRGFANEEGKAWGLTTHLPSKRTRQPARRRDVAESLAPKCCGHWHERDDGAGRPDQSRSRPGLQPTRIALAAPRDSRYLIPGRAERGSVPYRLRQSRKRHHGRI